MTPPKPGQRQEHQGRRPVSGFGVRGFRSFGVDEMQYVTPLSAVHLLAGPNDAGKSNMLRAIARSLPALRDGRAMAFDAPVDQPGWPAEVDDVRPQIALHVPLDEERAAACGLLTDRLTWQTLVELLSGDSFTAAGASDDTAGIWLEFSVAVDGDDRPTEPTTRQRTELLEAAHRLSSGRSASSVAVELGKGRPVGDAQIAAAILSALRERLDVLTGLTEVATVDTPRQITPDIAAQLLELHMPGLDRDGKRDLFSRISELIGAVLDRPAFELESSFDRREVVASLDDEPKRPVASFGSGLAQLIVLALRATDPAARVVLLEEPEAHLHPMMQRRLLDALHDPKAVGDRQFLIATHSAALISAQHVSITAVARDGAWSTTAPAAHPDQIAKLSRDLGFRASDLVQSNFVVWVEGPSDRVYLRHWLGLVDPDLSEGVHFSLVSYGGSLLRYLSPNDDLTPELVALPRLNRNFAVVIDRDREGADDPLTPAKERFRDAFAEANADGHLWLTEGYTFENYVNPDRLRSAVAEVHDGAELRWAGEPDADPLGPRFLDRASPAKVRIAAAVCASAERTWRADSDVEDHLSRLVKSIRSANGLAVR